MCTVTWLQTREGYDLRMNRDELRTRSVALPPAVYERNDIRYVAPRDVDGGGTWIAANDRGIAVCLLNGTVHSHDPRGVRSRGLLVDDLADVRSVTELRVRLESARLSDYSAFTLLALEPGQAAFIARWTGHTLVVDSDASSPAMLTSSSVDLDAVTATRTAAFREALRTGRGFEAESIEAMHRGHQPERSHRSVCMHREDAETVSYTRVTVCGDAVLVRYEDGPACSGLRFDPIAIARHPDRTVRWPMAGVR